MTALERARLTQDATPAASRMIDAIKKRGGLLDTVNRVASVLLEAGEEEFFEESLAKGMELIGRHFDSDWIQIWQNEMIGGELHFVLKYIWLSEVGKKAPPIEVGTAELYSDRWKALFLRGECINGPTAHMIQEDREVYASFGITSTISIPVFHRKEFWGIFCVDDCSKERYYEEDEIGILRSTALMLVNAINRNQQAVQIREALKAIQRANDAKSEFLANMSHEMRTPLNAIIGLTWLNLENENLDPETQSNLEKTHNAGATLLGIVNDILDISKIESGKLELMPVEYNVASVINDTVTQSLLRIGEKPVEFKLDVDKDMFANLYGDELRLKQIINNLLSNAMKFTLQGEVRLTTFCRRDGDVVWLTIVVSDTGQGIKQEDIGKIFDEYAQVKAKANRTIEGTGLGLPITKRLCEMMGGTINVESVYGKGSIFTARLKQLFVSGETIGEETVANLRSFRYSDGRRKLDKGLSRISLPYAHVLVVDDNYTNLDVARGLMKPYGMQIDCLDSGQKAIDAIRAEPWKYDALFMDQMMPGMDGMEATRRIRGIASEYAKRIPIIALTANATAGSEEMFLSKGFQAFLSKPIDISRLDAVIRQWVRNEQKEKAYSGVTPQAMPKIVKSGRFLSVGPIAGIDLERGLKRFGGDEESFASILQAFTASMHELLDSIEHPDEGNISAFEITVHGIKGACYNIFADEIGKSAEILELAAKSMDFAFISQYNPSFLASARALVADLEALLKNV